jgi:MYXO-CTERM domain-containing protein
MPVIPGFGVHIMSVHLQLISRIAVAAAVLLASAVATARPAEQSASKTEDDATVTVTILEEMIIPDTQSWCSIEVTIEGSDVAFSQGDSYKVEVIEDDPINNDLIWEKTVDVSAAEVSANRVQRTFDCSSDFGEDGSGSNSEIFGKVSVTKSNCGTFCFQDNPATAALDVAEVTDDTAEQDDNRGSAKLAGLGTTRDRISVDQDWFEFTLSTPSDVELRVEHRPSVGRIEATLFDASMQTVASSTDASDASEIFEAGLPAGTYELRVTPRDMNNPNFYDLNLSVTANNTTCSPGQTETRDCSMCGTEERTCRNDGSWGTWGGCMDQGVCTPGNTESESCPAGTKSRTCTMTCTWGDFGPCLGDECSGGETESCYSGPTGTAGVGQCTEGTKTCEDGNFGACVGEVTPEVEVCDDGIDNDCNDLKDDEDPACESAVPLGSSCGFDGDCTGDLRCLKPPVQPRFTDGYCSELGCSPGSSCAGGDGVCVTADATWCLRLCNDGSECRPGYRCTELPSGDRGCFPSCTLDEHCPIEDLGVCDTTRGVCVEDSGSTEPDMGDTTPTDDAGGMPSTGDDMGTTGGGESDMGPGFDAGPPANVAAEPSCAQSSPGAPARGGVLAALALMLAAAWRRRERR